MVDERGFSMTDNQVIRPDPHLDLGVFMNAPVSGAVRANRFVFVSGYIPMNPETGNADLGAIEVQTRRTLENGRLVLEQAGSSLEKVVKVNIFISDENDYQGLNIVYREYFPTDFPARRTILANLIGGFRVEIDCIALE
jgi:2-iminobutanoate/2-iminopropanoate deaminase